MILYSTAYLRFSNLYCVVATDHLIYFVYLASPAMDRQLLSCAIMTAMK